MIAEILLYTGTALLTTAAATWVLGPYLNRTTNTVLEPQIEIQEGQW